MSFQQGLSGLNAAAKSLDAIGNNVANSGTVGFKSSQVQFADVYAASLSGAGAGQIGLGTKVAGVAQAFSQGNVSTTNNPLDLAINGGGFFRLDTNGTVTYTRNGQFQMDKDGYIVNASGNKLTGYGVDTSGAIVATSPSPVLISAANLSPQATGSSPGALGAQIAVNLDSRELVPTKIPFNAFDTSTYNRSTPITVYDTLGNSHTLSTYYVKTAVPGTWDLYAAVDGVLDTPAAYTPVNTNTGYLGTGGALLPANDLDARAAAVQAAWPTTTSAPYVAATEVIAAAAAATTAAADMGASPSTPALILAAVNAAKKAAAAMALMNNAVIASNPTAGAQATEAALTATANTAAQTAAAATVIPAATLATKQLVFNTSGTLTTAMPFNISLDLNTAAAVLGKPNDAASPLSFNLDFTGTSQHSGAYSVNTLTQDGFSSGSLSGFSVSPDGIIQGRYSNGQSKNLGQVVLANFPNVQGLKPLGNNQWSETTESNQPLIGTPGSGKLGAMQSAAVEESNVDLTAELVNMITAQRAYQANAQTIKTQDSIMQTIVNLR
jgi:flagellar hook protein FlgE